MSTEFLPATLDQYLKWLKGFMKAGGRPTHFYNYPFGGFLYIDGKFSLSREDRTKHIILGPEGRLDPRKNNVIGNSTLFDLATFTYQGKALWVPVYNDKAFSTLPRIKEFIRAATEKSAAFAFDDVVEVERTRSKDQGDESKEKRWWQR